MGGFEITDRNQVRADTAAGGWILVWGDLINEIDAVGLAISIGTATPELWVQQQVAVQLEKFAQSLSDVSDDVISQASAIVEDAIKHKLRGNWDIDGLGIKAGVVTYHRWWQIKVGGTKVGGKNKLPNNYQPYIGLRVAKRLPPKGATATVVTGGGSPAPTPTPSRSPSPVNGHLRPGPPQILHPGPPQQIR